MISFNNIPTTQRTPGAFVEIDNSRALKGLVQNPHRVLIVGQKDTGGSVGALVLKQITNENVAAGFWGNGTLMDRMCRAFKQNNANTEVWAIALSDSGTTARASAAMSFTGSVTGAGTVYLLIGGVQLNVAVTSGWSGADICSAVKSDVNGASSLCLRVSHTAAASILYFLAQNSGVVGNYFDVRQNFYDGQASPSGITITLSGMAGGAGNPAISDIWAVVDATQFHHIVHPYTDATNLTSIEGELGTRFGPMVDMPGYGYTAVRGTQASCITLGTSRNSPYQTIIGANDSPTNPEIWAAALGGVASYYLNIDPARPLHYLTLKGVIPPTLASGNRFSQSERNTLLYDGIATWIVDAGGNVVIERCITTYRTNALGLADPSYLDIETIFTLMEIRYQYKTRMVNRFIIPRFKLADDGNAYPAGSKVATPSVVKQETVALFMLLRDTGLIENIDEFIENLVVERNVSDVNRIDVLLPPDVINQFRILAGQIQFVL